MSTTNGDDGVLHELEVNVKMELTLAETSQPEEQAVAVPLEQRLFEEVDAERYEIGLRGLLGAVEALKEDDSRPSDPSLSEFPCNRPIWTN